MCWTYPSHRAQTVHEQADEWASSNLESVHVQWSVQSVVEVVVEEFMSNCLQHHKSECTILLFNIITVFA